MPVCDHHFHHHRPRLARLWPWPLAKPVDRASSAGISRGAGRLDHAHSLGVGGAAGENSALGTSPGGHRGAQPGLHCHHPPGCRGGRTYQRCFAGGPGRPGAPRHPERLCARALCRVAVPQHRGGQQQRPLLPPSAWQGPTHGPGAANLCACRTRATSTLNQAMGNGRWAGRCCSRWKAMRHSAVHIWLAPRTHPHRRHSVFYS
jgi:hypothetical protein